MIQPTIATFLCIDTEAHDAESLYPELGGKRPAGVRRALYWKIVLVFGATARRSQPNARIVVVTNDTGDLTLEGKSLQQLLDELEVERVFTPFREFKPALDVSALFLNNFYRFDVLRALTSEIAPGAGKILLMDADCVWTKRITNWETLVPDNTLLITNPYGKHEPFERYPDRLSRADMGMLYRRVDETYPEKYPHWWGGELLGGSAETLRAFYNEVQRAWKLMEGYPAETPLRFPNGSSPFDNDEYVAAYAYNRGTIATHTEPGFFRRIYTQEFPNTVRRSDLQVAVWHLPGEKERGLRLLAAQVMDRSSAFWHTPPEQFPRYLGSYVGIPRRRYDMPYPPLKRAERHTRALVRRLRYYKNVALAKL
jgi:hypothetical protein